VYVEHWSDTPYLRDIDSPLQYERALTAFGCISHRGVAYSAGASLNEPAPQMLLWFQPRTVGQCDCLGAFEALAKMRGINVIIIIIIIITNNRFNEHPPLSLFRSGVSWFQLRKDKKFSSIFRWPFWSSLSRISSSVGWPLCLALSLCSFPLNLNIRPFTTICGPFTP